MLETKHSDLDEVAVPIAAPVPPIPTGPTMTAKAAGVTRESFIAQGWTDELLVQHGYMTM